MLPPNPAQKLYDAPLADLVDLLLKQFKRLLADENITLTTPELKAIGEAVADKQPLPEKTPVIIAELKKLVQASLDELKERFGRDFAESLHSDMGDIGGWETTADFLELANYKSNAELRISAGATLLTLLNEYKFTAHLFTVIAADSGLDDVDAVLAKRALMHASGIELKTPDDLKAIKNWLVEQS